MESNTWSCILQSPWADYLDALRAGGNVVSIFGKAS
jgi:hypothetical protein